MWQSGGSNHHIFLVLATAASSDDSEGDAGRDRDVIGVLVRHASLAPRVAGQLEDFYLYGNGLSGAVQLSDNLFRPRWFGAGDRRLKNVVVFLELVFKVR